MSRAIITKTRETIQQHNDTLDAINKQWEQLDKQGVKIYENQIAEAERIKNQFDDPEILVGGVYAQPQVGKTGILCQNIKTFMEEGVTIDCIFVISALSSIAWLKQMKKRLPELLHPNIYHRHDLLKSFTKNIKGKQNVLICIDEIQIACGERQTLSRAFEEAQLFDTDYLYENDIKIIQYSATPNGTLYELLEEPFCFINVYYPPKNYIGCKELYEQNRILDLPDISVDYDDYLNLIDTEIKKFPEPLIHIIRLNSINFDYMISLFCKKIPDSTYEEYTLEGISTTELDDLLLEKPCITTFIFLKEKARCSQTLSSKKYLGLLVDRPSPFDDVNTQSLIGRFCGYNDNRQSKIISCIASVEKYLQLIKDDFNNSAIEWKSNTTYNIDGINDSSGTINSEFTNMEQIADNIKTIEFTSYEQTILWLKEHYPYSRKIKSTQPKNGYYNAGPVFNYKVIEKKDINCHKILKSSQPFTVIRCYNNIKDSSTLIYLICYRN